MKLSKNNQITIIKLLAQIVSTYHMVDVLSAYGPHGIAIVAGLSLGLGEYKISQEYAAMHDRNKLKKLMLFTLIGLSAISMLANVESFARRYDWNTVYGLSIYYVWAAGIIYSVSMPAVIVATSFIKLQEDAKKEADQPFFEKIKLVKTEPEKIESENQKSPAKKKRIKNEADDSFSNIPELEAHFARLNAV